MLAAIVFDFDGVIANSEPLHLRAFQEALAELHVTLGDADYYERYLGYDDVGVFKAVSAEGNLGWSAERIAQLVVAKAVRLEALERDGSVLFPGAADAIRRAASRAPLAIASGALGPEIRRVLDRAGLTSAFRTIVSAEDTPVSKPAPDPYQLAVVRLSDSLREVVHPSRCVAIEDSHWGLQSARAAGLRTVAVAQTYDRRTLGEADLVIESIAELDINALERLCKR